MTPLHRLWFRLCIGSTTGPPDPEAQVSTGTASPRLNPIGAGDHGLALKLGKSESRAETCVHQVVPSSSDAHMARRSLRYHLERSEGSCHRALPTRNPPRFHGSLPGSYL
jgi:hypothetical protein